MKRIILYLVSIIGVMNISCTDEMDTNEVMQSVPLKLSVKNAGYSRALIENDYFTTAAYIGVKLVNTGTVDDYTPETSFLEYFHSGSSSSTNPVDYDNWSLQSGSSTPYLKSNPATVYAYYPYDKNKTDFTAIPVKSGQTDYMYGHSIEDVHVNQNYAMLQMQHALAAVRIKTKLGTAKTKKISSISIEGDGISSKGYMNVFTGGLNGFEGHGPVVYDYETALSLSSSFQSTDFALVTTGANKPLTVNYTDIYGTVSSFTTEAVTLNPGYIYTIEVSVNYGGQMTYDKISRDSWVNDNSGNVSFNVNGHTISCVGDMDGIALSKIINDDKVIINALPMLSYYSVNQVTVNGSASVSQNISSDIPGARIISLSNISSDITVSFNGVTSAPVVGTIDLTTANDGIYAVAQNNKGVLVENADESCKAVAFVLGNHRFMIEKNEYKNPDWNGETQLFGCYSSFDWPCRHTTADGTNTTGYLPQANGDYYSTPKLSDNNTTWTSGALSDFNGKTNSDDIISGYPDSRDMGVTLERFNQDETQNQGFNDWYIPACGQLALIYLSMNSINEALSKISGILLESSAYMSSTEYSRYNLWYVSFYNGGIGNDQKNKIGNVRFVRGI